MGQDHRLGGLATGMGYWSRANAEICLLAARGAPKRLAMDVHQVVMERRGEHSAKPEEVRRRIERLVGGPYLELFARVQAAGWTAWGNQAPIVVRPEAKGGARMTRRISEWSIDYVEVENGHFLRVKMTLEHTAHILESAERRRAAKEKQAV